MDRPLTIWAKILLRLGLVLLAVGVVPALLVQFVFTGFDPLVAVLLLFSVAPLGAIVLLIAVTLFLAALARRKPGGPA
jgi:polyferredoxin